jgi:uncharacterized protein (TIGR02646 family)
MIKLTPEPIPSELTPEVANELTDKFKQDKNNRVWTQDYIKNALLKMSHGKCCYCECKINNAGSDLHIEHFHPKDIYKDEVVAWENLLPACSRCNTRKGKLDTKKNPIIHPVKNNPKNHLKVEQYYFSHKDDLGEFTIEKLRLNDEIKLAIDRFQLGLSITKSLNDLTKEIDNYLANKEILNAKQETIISRKLTEIMQFGTSDKKYSAVMSSVILTNSDYQKIKQLFENYALWNDEFNELEKQVKFCALI